MYVFSLYITLKLVVRTWHILYAENFWFDKRHKAIKDMKPQYTVSDDNCLVVLTAIYFMGIE
jgi:hypothetical protein